MGQAVLPFEYLTPYFGYLILPPHWLVGAMPCPRKSQKELYERKDSCCGANKRVDSANESKGNARANVHGQRQ